MRKGYKLKTMAEKNDKLDWFPLYVYEFITDVTGWTNQEVGAYFRLLCAQWINEGLPTEMKRLSGIANESEQDFKNVWEHIGKKFTLSDRGYFNPKLEKVRKQQQKKIDKLSIAGSEGAEARWNKSKPFTPPTIAEIKAYCIERKNGMDAESFFCFYESKGWMIGKNKMKNWRMAVITWEKGRKPINGTQPQGLVYKKKEETEEDRIQKQKTLQLYENLKEATGNANQSENGLGSMVKKKMEQLTPKPKK